MSGIERLHEIMTRLRDPETGCPWDREQTLSSLKPCLLEETYELLAAMDRPEDKANYVEELGDVLLQIMFQSVMAEQEGRFTFDDVANAIADKLVHRHPHVFPPSPQESLPDGLRRAGGNVDAKDSATVLRNWEQIKQLEHRKESRHSALDGVPSTLPGLLKAQRTQEKAARVGFDWKDASGPLAKIREELSELESAVAAARPAGGDRRSIPPKDADAVKEELGDVLFSVCNLARHLGVDAESAVEGTTAKFSRRFRAVEAAAKARGRSLRDMSLADMDALWEEAKASEAKA